MPSLLLTWEWASSQSERRFAQLNGLFHRVGIPPPRADLVVRGLVLVVYASPIVTIGLTLIPVQWTVLSFALLAVLLTC